MVGLGARGAFSEILETGAKKLLNRSSFLEICSLWTHGTSLPEREILIII